ncbi:MAG: cysteine desulfuration protein SufE [Planctomycetota bacterium]|jgi:cysteine desulfuration protein SufE
MEITKLVSIFELFDSWEDRYRQIIELGKKLEPLDDGFKVPEFKVHGCTSQVWLTFKFDEQEDKRVMHFIADSDAHIVRGLIAILLMLFSNKTPAEIKDFDPAEQFGKLGLDKHLSPMRSNGLHSMVKRMKALAISVEAQEQ